LRTSPPRLGRAAATARGVRLLRSVPCYDAACSDKFGAAATRSRRVMIKEAALLGWDRLRLNIRVEFAERAKQCASGESPSSASRSSGTSRRSTGLSSWLTKVMTFLPCDSRYMSAFFTREAFLHRSAPESRTPQTLCRSGQRPQVTEPPGRALSVTRHAASPPVLPRGVRSRTRVVDFATFLRKTTRRSP